MLAGARKCLYERGYAHTTARDLVAASGTNLASIGYHFGSKEALLTEALISAFDEWGEELVHVARTNAVSGKGALEQMEALWVWMIESFDRLRPLMIANFEAFAQASHSDRLRAQLASYYERSRQEYVEAFAQASHSDRLRAQLASYYERSRQEYVEASREFTGVDGAEARAVGSFHMALLDGLMLQWILDPEHAPSGQEMAGAFRSMVELVRRDDASTPPSG
nr:TetR/AcrR family transcriptional regulator [Actinopolymorpha pittospori]